MNSDQFLWVCNEKLDLNSWVDTLDRLVNTTPRDTSAYLIELYSKQFDST